MRPGRSSRAPRPPGRPVVYKLAEASRVRDPAAGDAVQDGLRASAGPHSRLNGRLQDFCRRRGSTVFGGARLVRVIERERDPPRCPAASLQMAQVLVHGGRPWPHRPQQPVTAWHDPAGHPPARKWYVAHLGVPVIGHQTSITGTGRITWQLAWWPRTSWSLTSLYDVRWPRERCRCPLGDRPPGRPR